MDPTTLAGFLCTCLGGYFAIMNPIANTPVFISLTQEDDVATKKAVARNSLLYQKCAPIYHLLSFHLTSSIPKFFRSGMSGLSHLLTSVRSVGDSPLSIGPTYFCNALVIYFAPALSNKLLIALLLPVLYILINSGTTFKS